MVKIPALSWLEANASESPLASNHFGPRSRAISFVKRLHSAGARSVRIPQRSIRKEDWRIREEGGPYADALLVQFPADKRVQRKIGDVIAAERPNQVKKVGRDSVEIWWD